jgi:hypothetical protein
MAHVKDLDHLLLRVVAELVGLVGFLQQRDERVGWRAIPHGRRHDLRHEAVVVPQVSQLRKAESTKLGDMQRHKRDTMAGMMICGMQPWSWRRCSMLGSQQGYRILGSFLISFFLYIIADAHLGPRV